jgi:hypothetical protein
VGRKKGEREEARTMRPREGWGRNLSYGTARAAVGARMAKLLNGSTYVPSCAPCGVESLHTVHGPSGAAGWCIFTLVSGHYAVHLTSVSAFGGWSFALGVQHVCGMGSCSSSSQTPAVRWCCWSTSDFGAHCS